MELACPTCCLRPLQPTDAASLARHANDREIWLNLRDRFPHPYAEADALDYIAYARQQDPQTIFGIEVDGDAVGVLTLMPGHDIERLSTEVGYWLGRAYWGRASSPTR